MTGTIDLKKRETKMSFSMKNITRKFTVTGLIVLSVCLTCGCGTAPVVKLVKKSDDMGLVYIYRPKKFYYGSSDFDVNANGFKIDTLKNGGYFHYIAKPGRIQFSARTEITSIVMLDVQPGQTYYIRGSMTKGQLVGRPHLKVIAPKVAVEELKTYWRKIKGKKKKRIIENKLNNDPKV